MPDSGTPNSSKSSGCSKSLLVALVFGAIIGTFALANAIGAYVGPAKARSVTNITLIVPPPSPVAKKKVAKKKVVEKCHHDLAQQRWANVQ